MIVAQVALLSPPYATWDYALPDCLPETSWQVGQRVAVPLGNGLRVGVIVALGSGAAPAEQDPASAAPVREEGGGPPAADGPPPEGGSAPAALSFTLKAIAWPLERAPLMRAGYMELAKQLAIRQTSTVGRILGNLLPAGLRTTQVRIRFFGEGKPRELRLRDMLALDGAERRALADLWEEGRAEVVRAGKNPLDIERCVLRASPPWGVRPAARKQVALLEFLFEHGTSSRRKVLEAFGPSVAPALASLVGKGLVAICQEEATAHPLAGEEEGIAAPPVELPAFFTLTPPQDAVFAPMLQALHAQEAATHLLFGVTGSGKTAIYLELARNALALGRSVLLLAPEVALALKLWAEVQEALPEAPRFLFHGYQGPLHKEATFWELARRTSPCIVVGTRSALLLPLENVGLILLDEEHDASFKQDEGFTYQAKEVAWYRAGTDNALLVLGSATPDMKSFHAAVEGRIPLHRLDERVGGGDMPEVRLVALPKGRLDDGLLIPESTAALQEVVARGEQAVILLNRRGYAPLMYCLGCNTVAKCPHCDIALAYHKGRERLLCHYCGHAVPYPSPCSACKGMHFLPMGEGTEKIEEHLATSLPAGTGILRLDRDSTRRAGSMEAILRSFARKEASVLVGTQMLSKGHHFPDVTLAIVADADLGLNLPDYRAAERTFQLLLQSAGRAGRGEKKGRVLIQTRDPGHYCWQHVREADYEGFYAHEIALRQRRHYPPFVRLALIRISFPADVDAQEQVASLGAFIRRRGRELGLTVLGPAPAPLPFLQGRRRFHCLIKATDWQPLRALFTAAYEASRKGHLRVTLDLDPVNML